MLRRLLAGIAALTLVAAAPTAIAAGLPKRPLPHFDGAIELQGTHGYRVSGIVASTATISVVTLFVGKRGESAVYSARGSGTANSIDVDLGRLGKVEVEVRPTGANETLHKGCDGKGKALTIPGSELVGTIDFRGEEGFTEVEATHTPLLIQPLLQLVCPGASFGTVSGSHVGGVQVTAKVAGGPSLTLQQNHLGASVLYEAEMHEKEGKVRVSRSVEGHLGGGALRYAPSLASAGFSAASPFSGSASYTERTPPGETRPGRGAWRGSLKVDFPGDTGVPLAGPGFKASIAHAHRIESSE